MKASTLVELIRAHLAADEPAAGLAAFNRLVAGMPQLAELVAADAPALPIAIAPAPIRVIVDCTGGVFQGCSTDTGTPLSVIAVDYETDPDDDSIPVPQHNGEWTVARVTAPEGAECEPDWVAAMFDEQARSADVAAIGESEA